MEWVSYRPLCWCSRLGGTEKGNSTTPTIFLCHQVSKCNRPVLAWLWVLGAVRRSFTSHKPLPTTKGDQSTNSKAEESVRFSALEEYSKLLLNWTTTVFWLTLLCNESYAAWSAPVLNSPLCCPQRVTVCQGQEGQSTSIKNPLLCMDVFAGLTAPFPAGGGEIPTFTISPQDKFTQSRPPLQASWGMLPHHAPRIPALASLPFRSPLSKE